MVVVVRKKTFNLRDVDFAKIADDKQLMEVFIKYARAYPNRGRMLFKKYVDYLCDKNPDEERKVIRKEAALDIGYLAGYYDYNTYMLLFDVYKTITHPIHGRVR